VVDVRGSGRLAEVLRAELDGEAGVVVAAFDSGPAARLSGIRAVTDGQPLLVVRAEWARVAFGPFEREGRPGCTECAARRARRASPGGAALADLTSREPTPGLAGPIAHLVGELVASDVTRLADGTARADGAVVTVGVADLDVAVHPLVADPLCPVCGDLPEDTAERAAVHLPPTPKRSAVRYRGRDFAPGEVERVYVDAHFGVVRRVDRSSSAALALATAPLGLPDEKRVENGFGRSLDYDSAATTAVLEALERSGGMRPAGKRTAVTAAYTEVADHAVDVRTLGEHDPVERVSPGFPYPTFDPRRPLRWVWGHSFGTGSPVLVPEALAYYGVGHGPLYEISNGCALGGSLAEAVLHGVLEVVERDCFLMAFHAGLALPEVDPTGERDVAMLAERLAHTSGFRVRLFDATTENRVPAVWAVAENPRADGRAATVSAAGAHLRPASAAAAALCELGPILDATNRRLPREADHAARLAADDANVRTMSDHALLHAHPAARPRLDFLLAPRGEPMGFAEAFCRPEEVIGGVDLAEDLLSLIRRLAEHGVDVVVVDQTTPEHAVAGLRCVKVLAPGMLPMTFGHRFRRLTGLPRLRAVPAALGYRRAGAEVITTSPHPFP
jgi:ribosomal protein S12 methylthiotransferase accessory factor